MKVKKRDKENIQELWKNHTNTDKKKKKKVCVIELPEGEEIYKGTEEIFEIIISENFHK